MVDEVTDLSNPQQFVICLRWVEQNTFEVNEDLIGLYHINDIVPATLIVSVVYSSLVRRHSRKSAWYTLLVHAHNYYAN